MQQEIVQFALLVDDYDRALDFYIQKLKFNLIEDTRLTEHKRWVLISPPGSTQCKILLAKATNEEQKSRIGNQSGGRVFIFMHTDDLERDYIHLKSEHIKIVREPAEESWGKVLVFEDCYGNLWDLIEPK